MAWTRDDYPPSFKNFDEITRLKAIDIANAMAEEGYEADRAIPIAVSQAKEWAKDATAKEKKELKHKDITDHEKDGPSGGRLQDRDVEVRYREEEGKWEVRSTGAKQADSLYNTKKEAQKRAAEITRYRDGKVIYHTKEES